MPSSPLIETVSVLGKKIRTSEPYWEHIVRDKHGELAERLPDALETLRSPDEVYRQGETRCLPVLSAHQQVHPLRSDAAFER